MSPTGTAPGRRMNPLKRWNSIIGPSEHKRSQSLNEVNPHLAPNAMRSTASLSTLRYIGDDEQSIASSHDSIAEEAIQVSPTTSSHSRSSVVSTSPPPPRPKPAPRLWQETCSPGDSLRGLETAIAPNHSLPFKHASPILGMNGSPPMDSSPVLGSPYSPKSVVSKFSTWKEKSFAGRRKGSLPDLQLTSAKYSQSFCPDCLGLPPILSARTPNTAITHGSITPKPMSGSPIWPQPPAFPPPDPPAHAALKTPEWKEKDVKRASSMLLPQALAPIVIPSPQANIPPVPRINTSIVTEERPPRPPPKSPRTLLRAFPVPRSTSIVGVYPSDTSVGSISPTETPSTAATTWSPVSVESATVVKIPQSFNKSPSRINNATVSFDDLPRTIALGQAKKLGPSTMKHRTNMSTVESGIPPRKSSSPALHSRRRSNSPIMNRGRPMKRGEVVIARGTDRGLAMGTINDNFDQVPNGVRINQTGRISIDELSDLRRDAEEVASNYNILTQKQIADLNHEQTVLDNSCDRFHNTISCLKETRNTAYSTLKLSLEQSASTLALRDHIMSQTRTLNSLDSEIDEWQSKLDVAMERKLAIQSRIWEHLTAILTAVTTANDVGTRRAEEYTPPRSPERIVRSFAEDPFMEDAIAEDGEEEERSPRHDVESITIYADSGVAGLLRSIEEELDVIDQSRYELMAGDMI